MIDSHTIETKVGTFNIDLTKVSVGNLRVGSCYKWNHMLKNEVISHMLSWEKTHPKATPAEIKAEHIAAINRMVTRIYDTDLTVKASAVRLTPIESKLRELLQSKAKTAYKAQGIDLRGEALADAVKWYHDNEPTTVASLRKVAEKSEAGIDKIVRKATPKEIGNILKSKAA